MKEFAMRKDITIEKGGTTMKKYVNMQEYARKAHFDYFRTMAYPYVGTTVNVDITDFMEEIKKTKTPFYLSFLYRVIQAANSVVAFRQRIEEEQIVEYTNCKASCVLLKDDETYCYCTLDGNIPFEEFLRTGPDKMKQAKEAGGIEEGEEVQSFFFISCVPWISYTSIVQAVPSPADSNPRITWGKYFEQDGKQWIPVSVLMHHALADGLTIARFYERLNKELKPERE